MLQEVKIFKGTPIGLELTLNEFIKENRVCISNVTTLSSEETDEGNIDVIVLVIYTKNTSYTAGM